MDSALNITIRVAGRQAQSQLRAVARDLDNMQKTLAKGTKIQAPAAPSSAWSPAVAQRQAKQAEAVARKHARELFQINKSLTAWTTQEEKKRANEQNAIRMKEWNRQQSEFRANARQREAATRAANQALYRQQQEHEKKMAKLGGLSPLGFAKNLGASQLVNAGKNINWVGRQLTYNFTLPLVVAGGALFKFAMDNEKAMTQLTKLYGNVGDDSRMLKAETDALAKSFELMSSRFGIVQADVINVGAAWAAVGAAGVAVAEGTKATIETAILGDIDLQQATEALIAVQQQWGFSTQKNETGVSELTLALAQLNMVENVSGASMADLLEVNERAAGVARTAGLSIGQLAALTASLVPATGSAAQAGTALRSIISSLQAPTAASQEILKAMGITVTDPNWMGATAIQKIEQMATKFNDLSDAQKTVVSSTVATKWQVSRFEVIMRDVMDPLGKYQQSMAAIADDSAVMAQRQRELNAVLDSNPKKFEIVMNVMKNTLTSAFIPMIPAILSIVKLIADLALAFQNLNPEFQKWILIGLAAIAMLGPLMSLLGSTMQLFGTFGSIMKGAGTSVGWFIKNALLPLIKVLGMVGLSFLQVAADALVAFLGAIGPIGWAVIAAIAVITAAVMVVLHTDLEDKIWDVVVSIAKAFWELPKAIGQALLAVARTIGNFMTGIVDALSYLNPFQRHSPSLVDNVRAGVATILDEYSKFSQIPGLIRGATNALANFSTATNSQGQTFREHDLQKKADQSNAANPAASGATNAMVQSILALERAMPALEAEINNQEVAVAQWAAALKEADAVVDGLEANLKVLETQYGDLGDQIAAANKRIGELADTPIQGMTALGDAIFENELAQNKLNMELLQFEKQGMTLDSIRDKYAAMAGEIETLQGTQAELRNAGAGSDILSWYDDQIAGIQDQKKEMGGVEKQIVDINAQLDALDLEGRFLELTKAINFDPLERQIDKIANKVVEMPFDEIVRQIQEQQAIIEKLTPEYDAIGAAVEHEKDNIEAAKAARDGVAAQLDIEQAKLDALKDAYSDIKGLISDMEGALNDFASSAKEAADEASRLEELFAAGEGLNWDDQGGSGKLGREGGLPEIEKFNTDMQKELEDALAGMGTFDLKGMMQDAINDLANLDFLSPLKAAWDKVKGWFGSIGNWIKEHLWVALTAAFWFVGGSVIALYYGLYKVITTYVPIIAGWINDHVIQPVWQAIQDGWDIIVGAWNWIFENLITPVINFGTMLYNFLAPIVTGVWDVIVQAFQFAWGIIEPIFKAIWSFIDSYIIPIFQLFQVIALIVFKLIELAITHMWDIISWVFGVIMDVINNFVVPAFEWLWKRGEEVFGLLGSAMRWTYDHVIEPVFNAFEWVVDNVVLKAFNWMSDEIGRIWNGIGAALQWTWDNVFSPIWDGFKKAFDEVVAPAFRFLRDKIITPIMDTIYTVIAGVWNGIATVIEGGVNFFIKAFNLIGSAVNAVAGFLQIDARVGDMPEISLPRIDTSAPSTRMDPVAPGVFAAGGIPDASAAGGRYNTPRAIVGEGNPMYPEFVIPTDPQYRSRALALMEQAGTRLMAAGGVIANTESLADEASTSWQGGNLGGATVHGGKSWIGGIIDKLVAAGQTIAQGAIAAIWKPGKYLADKAIDVIPNKTFKSAGHGIMNVLDSWIMNRDTDWNNAIPTINPDGTGATGNTGSGASASGIPITHGSGSWQAFVTLLQQQGIPYQNLGTYANRGTKYGTPSMHAQNRAMDFGGTQAQLQRIDHALYDAFKTQLYELIWTGPDARNVYKGNDHVFRSEIANDHRTHVHASMAQGGQFYIPRTPGGVNLNVAEGRSGEKIQILPIDQETAGGTTIVINGNLEFPNIKSGGDAKDFIENLRALAT